MARYTADQDFCRGVFRWRTWRVAGRIRRPATRSSHRSRPGPLAPGSGRPQFAGTGTSWLPQPPLAGWTLLGSPAGVGTVGTVGAVGSCGSPGSGVGSRSWSSGTCLSWVLSVMVTDPSWLTPTPMRLLAVIIWPIMFWQPGERTCSEYPDWPSEVKEILTVRSGFFSTLSRLRTFGQGGGPPRPPNSREGALLGRQCALPRSTPGPSRLNVDRDPCAGAPRPLLVLNEPRGSRAETRRADTTSAEKSFSGELSSSTESVH